VITIIVNNYRLPEGSEIMEETNLIAVPYQAPAPLNINAQNLIDSFFAGKSPKTVEAYKKDLQDFQKFLGEKTEREAATKFVRVSLGEANSIALQYRQHLIERGLQATTINRRLAALRSLTQMARTLGIITWKLEIRNQKTQSYRNTAGPGKTGVQKLREEISRRTDAKGLRDKAILHLLYDLALRRSEVVGLDLADVDSERGTLQILGKGRLQKETLTIPTRTRKILKAWLAVRGGWEGPVFINFHHDGTIKGKRLTSDGLYYIIKHLGKKTGQKVRPHGLRHTSISEAVRKTQAIGMDVTKVMKFSRHKNLNTLQVYVDAVEGAQGEIAELVAMD
jgi:integrase/recombinase XerC